MAKRVVVACEDLRSTGTSLMSGSNNGSKK